MTLWPSDEVGDTQSSKKHLMEIFQEYDESDLRIHAPKPVDLVRRIVEIATKSHGLVLDSFAGTGPPLTRFSKPIGVTAAAVDSFSPKWRSTPTA